MYAVVQTGGKQLRVAVGQSIQVEKLPGTKGNTVEFDRVLCVSRDDQLLVGAPLVDGATVIGTVSRQERGDKVIVFRYKSKKRVRVTKGHRQSLTRVFIRDILLNGESLLPPKPEAEPARPLATTEPAMEATVVGEAPTETRAAAPEATSEEAADATLAAPEAADAADNAEPDDTQAERG